MQLAPIYKNKKVLVTGHTGFKGSWLCEWLLDLGAQVCGYSIDIPTKPSHFEILGLEKRIMHHQGDVRDLKKLSGIFSEFKPDFVFHLAAQPLVRVSYDHPVETFETNVVGTVNVLECIRKTDSVKVAVLVATDKCYENKEWEFGYRETDRLGGADPYSASK
ncbi:MAG: GDP-mannose 4,6-dehydratase, partial [Pseudobdellovibrionaceae bacterium]